MYVFPDNIKTWIIGDGYFANPGDTDPYYVGPLGGAFYKSTDVGYLRFIFYFGVLGLFAFVLFLYIYCFGKIKKISKADADDVYTKSEVDTALSNKLDVTAYTPTDLSNYYTKSETSGATEISTALSAKASKTEDLDGVKLKKITQSAYDALVQAGTVDLNTLYIITD